MKPSFGLDVLCFSDRIHNVALVFLPHVFNYFISCSLFLTSCFIVQSVLRLLIVVRLAFFPWVTPDISHLLPHLHYIHSFVPSVYMLHDIFCSYSYHCSFLSVRLVFSPQLCFLFVLSTFSWNRYFSFLLTPACPRLFSQCLGPSPTHVMGRDGHKLLI